MSAGMLIDHAERIARAMRLEDVLINASAVPIPIDLMPSAMAGPPPEIVPEQESQTDTRAGADNGDQVNGAITHAAHVDQSLAAVPIGETGHDGLATDAILNSLQAAREAIHDSLRQDGNLPDQNAAPSVSADSSTGTTAEAISPHDSNNPLETMHLGNSAGDALHTVSAGDSPLDIVAQVSQGIADVAGPLTSIDLPKLVTAVSAGPEMTLGPILDTIASVVAPDTDSQHPGAAASLAVVAEVADTVGIVTNSAADAAVGAVDHAQDVIQDIVHDVVSPIVGTLTAAVAPVADSSLSALADALPAPAASLPAAVAEAVTVPSLGGAGVDALAGLLQAPSIAAEAPHLAADSGHAISQDIPSFAPIGIEHVADAADMAATHAVHSTLHLVGSGLI